MAKKKKTRHQHQQNSAKQDSDDEQSDSKCIHLCRALNQAAVKKILKANQELCVCQPCGNVPAAGGVWLCLQCGHVGCGAETPSHHGLHHYRTPRSDCHALAAHLDSWLVWCYTCEKEVNLQTSVRLKELINFLKKNAVLGSPPSQSAPVLTNGVEPSLPPQAPPTKPPEPPTLPKTTPTAKSKTEPHLTFTHVKGLENLGNTCFFNSVVQCLNQTQLLHELLESHTSPLFTWSFTRLLGHGDCSQSENFSISLEGAKNLTASLANFLKQMRAPLPKKGHQTLSPSVLFGEIIKKCAQFKDYNQQDSHELLRSLLDSLRTEQMKRQKNGLLHQFKLFKSIDPKEEATKKTLKALSRQACHTLVDKIFGGHIISTVLCQECHYSSQLLEPFLDLSLPLFDEPSHHQGPKEQVAATPYVKNRDGGTAPLSKHQQKKAKKLNRRAARLNNMAATLGGKPTVNNQAPNNNEEEETKAEREDLMNRVTDNRELEEQTELNEEEYLNNDEEDEEETTLHNNSLDETEKEVMEEKAEKGDSENETTNGQLDMEPESTNDKLDESKLTNGNLEKHPETANDKQDESNMNNGKLEKHPETANEKLEESKLTNGMIEKHPETTNDELDMQPISTNDKIDEKQPQSTNDKLEEQSKMTNGMLVEQTEILKDDKEGKIELMNGQMEDQLELINDNSKEKIEMINGELEELPELINDNAESKTEIMNGDMEDQPELINDNKEIKTELINGELKEQPEIINDNKEIKTELMNGEVEENGGDGTIENGPCEEIQDLCHKIQGMSIRNSDKCSAVLRELQAQVEKETGASVVPLNTSMEEEECSDFQRDFVYKCMTTLAPHPDLPTGYSVLSCLQRFTAPEHMMGENKFLCERCTKIKNKRKPNGSLESVYSNATLQVFLLNCPPVLTLHLKRFHQDGYSLKKVEKFVSFPLLLDVAPYTSSVATHLPHMRTVQSKILYSLYGVVEHQGRLSRGHFTAYIRSHTIPEPLTYIMRTPLDLDILKSQLLQDSVPHDTPSPKHSAGRWYHVSDTSVREVTEAQVLRCQAYLLFYQRIL